MLESLPIRHSYIKLNAINLGVGVLRDETLLQGTVVARVAEDGVDDDRPPSEGTLNGNGVLSGMAAIHRRLHLRDGDVVVYEATAQDAITITEVIRAEGQEDEDETEAERDVRELVLDRESANHIGIEVFSPENLRNWEPRTEPDVYMAFGVLQEFTNYRYCCGASQSLLDDLGVDLYREDGRSKPDAILMSRINRAYAVAEFKIRASQFRGNHRTDEVDVLVCWEDDLAEELPIDVVALREIAREAAQEALLED